MPPIPADKLTDAQKKAIEEFKAARSVDISGPFVAMLRSPEVMTRARAMGDYLRFRSSLPPRLSEFVILLTARRWTQQYEWNAHAPLAIKGGLSASIVKAIADGRRPEGLAEDEEIVYALFDEIQKNQACRRHLRAGGRENRRAGHHRRDGHHRLLHDARDGDEHSAYPVARRREAALAPLPR